MDIDKLDEFTRAYIECALWSSTDTVNGEDVNLDDDHGIEDIAPETMGAMIADCQRFQTQHSALLKSAYAMQHKTRYGLEDYTASQAGHDFWLTRCGHGAGFWDRGLGDIGKALSDACGWKTDYPEIDLYLGDDGRIYA